MGAVLVVLFGSEIRKFLLMPGPEIPHGTIISAALVPRGPFRFPHDPSEIENAYR